MTDNLFSSDELLKKLLKIEKVLGKAQVKKSKLTLDLNTNHTSVIITGQGLSLSFIIEAVFTRSEILSYELSDIMGILELDKSRFKLNLDEKTLNDFPIFTTDSVSNEVGVVEKTVEVEDLKPFQNKDVLPSINKLLKKSLLHESEYLQWRIETDKIQLTQVFPTDWGVRFEQLGEYGANFCVYTNKIESKLIVQLLSGRFKISLTDCGYIFEDKFYKLFISKRDDLNDELYPPFTVSNKERSL